MTALLEMNPLPAQSEPVDRPKAPMRFAYPSGSRPLEGYTIKRGVGRGGFGEVYFAVSDAGKEVALKLIRRNLEVELRGVTHCLNLKHPNLVAVYDIRSDEHDDHWVVMEYVGGESLEETIDRYPQGMPAEHALHWFDGICSAVAYLHDHGIVHRDLKPANIFMDEGRVKIGDYGLSKFISCSRRSGQTESVGTVHYMAPEIANGRYGREIDAYALGIILYEMLTGRVPFEGESVGEVLMKHLTAEPDLNALGEPFRTVVCGAMAKDPDRRINSAADMVAMLHGSPPPSTVPGTERLEQTAVYRRESDSAGGSAPGRTPYPHTSPAAPVAMFGASAAAQEFTWREFFHRDPEPVLAAARASWKSTIKDLQIDTWNPWVKFIAIVALISCGGIWGPLVITMFMVYLGYLVVRGVYRGVTTPPTPISPTKPPTAAAGLGDFARAAAPDQPKPPVVPRSLAATRPWRRRQASWRQAANAHVVAQPLRQRTSELLGSMIVAAGVAAASALLITAVTQSHLDAPLFMWTAVVTTVGSWAILVPSKLMEARIEDQTPMRILQLGAGILVGAVAWLAADVSMLSLPVSRDIACNPNETVIGEMFNWKHADLGNQYNLGAVQMPAAMSMAYFAFLFLILRWWRQAEWTRNSRVSVWAVLWCVFIGWAASFFWWFPQPIGMLVAGAIALSVQLASPWCPPSRRRQLAEAAVA